MKIWTLMENTACDPIYRAEHGLSFYIETKQKKILFDAGQSSAFVENAKILGVDLSGVDFAVLSHGHYDHGGGLKTFLEINDHAPVYVSKHAFGGHYNAKETYIGLEPSLQENERIVAVDRELHLAEGITLLSNAEKPECTFSMLRKEGDRMVPEDFRHEQYLLVEEDGKRVLFSGCSHKGIRSIVKWIQCDVLVGGFHFMKMDPEGQEVRQAARELLQHDTRYYTGHCTGIAQYQTMKAIMTERLEYLPAGSFLEI